MNDTNVLPPPPDPGWLDEADYGDVWAEIAAYEKEVTEYNENLLRELGKGTRKYFMEMIEGITVAEKIGIVDGPDGDFQKGERFGYFSKIYVDQRSLCDCGDSFAGFIYARHHKAKKWLKIPFNC